MKHFLAYGNSDQASFREPSVQEAIDFMTVPGTIAAYYPDATAAFVLTSQLNYIIDPRTPLFQGTILQPKASHVSLAKHMGENIQSLVGDGKSPVRFSASNYSPSVINEATLALVEMQRNYGGRAESISEKMDYYRSLMLEATGSAESSSSEERRSPSFVLAPYFAVQNLSDSWWSKQKEIWNVCATLGNPESISPVIAVSSPDDLAAAASFIPAAMSKTVFFWITGFDERKVGEHSLLSLWNGLPTGEGVRFVNLYGSFFSICMQYQGLWGINNGLGYSESRNWPELTSTGAAPARYYVPRLHMYLPPATARLVIEQDDYFSCDCALCGSNPQRVTSLTYHELKQHFVAARSWEVGTVEGSTKEVVSAQLQEASTRFTTNVRSNLPGRISIDTSYLAKWAEVVASTSHS